MPPTLFGDPANSGNREQFRILPNKALK